MHIPGTDAPVPAARFVRVAPAAVEASDAVTREQASTEVISAALVGMGEDLAEVEVGLDPHATVRAAATARPTRARLAQVIAFEGLLERSRWGDVVSQGRHGLSSDNESNPVRR